MPKIKQQYQDISRQIKALKGGVQIIIGTPGRLMDHLRRKTIRPDHVKTIVLDEADEMLNMGFREDIETVLEYLPQEHQTVLFSATMPKPILEITRKYQHDAINIKIVKKELTVANIDQYYYDVKRKASIPTSWERVPSFRFSATVSPSTRRRWSISIIRSRRRKQSIVWRRWIRPGSKWRRNCRVSTC